LRAVAVSGVLVYHFSPGALPSGFLGVDVFMAVSGFIVTNLLLRERARLGRIRVGAFWGRRFRRLVPALVLMVVVVTALLRYLAPTSVASSARGQGLAAMLYVTNWKLISAGVSYGGAIGARSPFVHLWSLAVEEQFYLVWPLVLIALLAISRKRAWPVVTATALGAVASAAWMAYLYDPGQDPLRLYYGTDTRAQAFLIGALAALVAPHVGARSRAWLRVLGPISFVGLLFVMTTDAPGFLYRGGFALVALGAALCALATTHAGPLVAALDRPALRELGRVSYGVYLWHWPAVTLLTPDRVGANGLSLLALRLAFTGAGTAISWLIIERPLTIARPRRIALTGGVGVSVATVALVALPAGHAFAYSNMRTDRVPTPIVFTSSQPRAVHPARRAHPKPRARPVRVEGLTLPAQGTAMIVGDSGMYSATPAFAAGLDAAGWRVVETAYPGIGLSRLTDQLQQEWSSSAREYHVDLTIVMLGSWDLAWEQEHGGNAYRDLIDRSVASFRSGGGKVLWLSALPGGDSDAGALDRYYADLEHRYPGVVDYFDVRSALAAPDGSWPRVLDGRVLRQLDGWHLCQDGADAVATATLDHVGLGGASWHSGDWRDDGRYAPANEGCPR
jgi:peptidoglycan/LPS O-acetylase OafA/YrhL